MPELDPNNSTGSISRFAWIVAAYAVAIATAVLTLALLPDLALLWRAFAADVAATLVIFGFSYRFKNSSFYDAYWSVAPPLLLVLFWWSFGALWDIRVVAAAALTLWWSIRLTYNWGYGWTGLTHEDWRYENLQHQTGAWYWFVSLFGIHLLPTIWVFVGCFGLYAVNATAGQPDSSAWNRWDSLATAVGVAAVWLESQADRELHRFRAQRASAAEHLHTGVWAWCRHPNYLGEIGFWLALSLYGFAANHTAWWVWLGPGVMLLLFLGVSIPMLERKLTAEKPGYAAYAARTFALLPLSAWFYRDSGNLG